jgi:hypothetical protein
MSRRALGCQVYYLVLSYALLLALLGRLASEQTALAGFASGFHHFNLGALAQRQSEISGGDCLGCSSRERQVQLGWTTALVISYLRLALPLRLAIR